MKISKNANKQNLHYINLFTNKGAGGIYSPLFGREIGEAYENVQTQFIQKATAEPLINTMSEITVMLQALRETFQGNPRFEQVHPVIIVTG